MVHSCAVEVMLLPQLLLMLRPYSHYQRYKGICLGVRGLEQVWESGMFNLKDLRILVLVKQADVQNAGTITHF